MSNIKWQYTDLRIVDSERNIEKFQIHPRHGRQTTSEINR
jgi:hypothetical protein